MQKKLYKVNEGKMIDGVCGGIGEYFDVDPTLIRLAWVLLVVFMGTGILAYIIAAIVMPRKEEGNYQATKANNTTVNTNPVNETETKTEVYEENVIKKND